jgi:site-specific recombinase XerD
MNTKSNQHIESFLAYLTDKNGSPLTRERYSSVLIGLFEYVRGLGKTELGDINKGDLISFLRAATGINGHEAAPQAASTWNSKLGALRSFFAWASREDLVEHDPAAKVEFAKIPRRSPVFLTWEEYQHLREVVRTTATSHYRARDEAIIVTLFGTGLRVSELVSLDLFKIDFQARTIHDVKVKGGDVVSVDMNKDITRALRAWLPSRETIAAEDEVALFVSDRGQRISVRAVQDLFTKYSAVADLGKKITPHTIRHSTGSDLAERGVDICVIQHVLRHKSIVTTQKYTHLTDKIRRRAVDMLAKAPGDAGGSIEKKPVS